MPRRAIPAALPLPDLVVLVLQGGGALGAFQAGVYEAMIELGIELDWVAGISIGAVNAAIIAGNPRDEAVRKLREFWDGVSSVLPSLPTADNDWAREWAHMAAAGQVAAFGVPGFFTPRWPPPSFAERQTPEAVSFYDTAPLAQTLDRLVDWDRVNKGNVRLSVGAVAVETGNFRYFDTKLETLDARHILASGALPPGLPPVEIDGCWYWDGGLVSNTPLQYVLDQVPRPDMLVFQVDLFSARGPMPRTILDVSEREKDIRYSSRTRLNTDFARHTQELRRATHRLVKKLPAKLRDDPDAKLLRDASCNAAVTIVHLIHRRKDYFTQSKDYEFSRQSIEEHWKAGRDDVSHTFRHKAWKNRSKPTDAVKIFDLTRDVTD